MSRVALISLELAIFIGKEDSSYEIERQKYHRTLKSRIHILPMVLASFMGFLKNYLTRSNESVEHAKVALINVMRICIGQACVSQDMLRFL